MLSGKAAGKPRVNFWPLSDPQGFPAVGHSPERIPLSRWTGMVSEFVPRYEIHLYCWLEFLYTHTLSITGSRGGNKTAFRRQKLSVPGPLAHLSPPSKGKLHPCLGNYYHAAWGFLLFALSLNP